MGFPAASERWGIYPLVNIQKAIENGSLMFFVCSLEGALW
jgi:hypothetical protein